MPRLENVGFVHFDIPDRIKRFANWLRKKLRKGRALPASMSCYLVNWSDTPMIRQIIDEAKAAYIKEYPDDEGTVNGLVMNVLKVDDASAEEAAQMAVEGLARLIGQVQSSLVKALKKIEKDGEIDLPRRIQVGFVRKMQEAMNLAIAFRLMEDVQVALDAMQTAITAQIGAKVAAKYLPKTETAGATK
jgi:hypothetical protein